MRIVFMGTPEIAESVLERLINSGHEIAAVYTRQDKPVGRKQLLTPPPVKILAEKHGIPVFQPKTLRRPESIQELSELKPDVIIVVAYGLILPKELLEIPPMGCVNIHVSLLPKYRGAAPVQWALINGEEKTGISIMRMDEGIDTGPVISQYVLNLDGSENAKQVLSLSAEKGGELLLETLEAIEKGTARETAQTGSASYAPMLTKEIAKIDFSKTSEEVHNLVRGCNPWPLGWFIHDGKRIKLIKTSVVGASGKVAEIINLKPLTIACGKGAIVFERLVPQGSKEMDGSQWTMGRRFKTGEFLIE